MNSFESLKAHVAFELIKKRSISLIVALSGINRVFINPPHILSLALNVHLLLILTSLLNFIPIHISRLQ